MQVSPALSAPRSTLLRSKATPARFSSEEVRELNSEWKLKRDPEHHPVRFFADVWQQRMKANFRVTVAFTSREFGQLRDLRKALGAFTGDVIEWMMNPVNWWHFCQQVRAERGLNRAPDCPHVGFLLTHYRVSLKVMRWELRKSSLDSDVLRRLEQREYERLKTLLKVYALDTPELLPKIAEATTLIQLQQVFIEV
jgi:hypothetical protein